MHQNKSRIILNDEFRAKMVADIDFNQENGTEASKIGKYQSNQFIKTSADVKEVKTIRKNEITTLYWKRNKRINRQIHVKYSQDVF